MTCKTVKTQTDLDAALTDGGVSCVHIESERGLWLHVYDNHGKAVVAWGSSSVVARGSSSVEARDSSSVVAWDSSSVVAWGSSSVVARGSSSVVARGSSSVVAWDSSSVVAWDSSSVVARDSSSVEARGATRVSARHDSTVTAGAHVAVHLHSAQATVTGGVLVDLTQLDLTDPAVWCEHHGVQVDDGQAVLFKAVDSELTAGRGYGKPTVYTIGSEVACDDWSDNTECGGGLHLSPHPRMAGEYERGPAKTRRYLRVSVAVADLRPISADKCKTPRCLVLAEVDIRGRELAATQDLDGVRAP